MQGVLVVIIRYHWNFADGTEHLPACEKPPPDAANVEGMHAILRNEAFSVLGTHFFQANRANV